METGACKNAYSIDQLIDYIKLSLKNPTLEKGQRKNLVDQEITTNKGVAGEAIGNYIAGLLQNDTMSGQQLEPCPSSLKRTAIFKNREKSENQFYNGKPSK